MFQVLHAANPVVSCALHSNPASCIMQIKVNGLSQFKPTFSEHLSTKPFLQVPHDHPYYGQLMIERWVEEAVLHRAYNRMPTEEEEQLQLRIRGSDAGQWAGPA